MTRNEPSVGWAVEPGTQGEAESDELSCRGFPEQRAGKEILWGQAFRRDPCIPLTRVLVCTGMHAREPCDHACMTRIRVSREPYADRSYKISLPIHVVLKGLVFPNDVQIS